MLELYELHKVLTWGSKTFQYPQEKKTMPLLCSGNISLVAASEKEGAQTVLARGRGCKMTIFI